MVDSPHVLWTILRPLIFSVQLSVDYPIRDYSGV